jgi:hypothetical protein
VGKSPLALIKPECFGLSDIISIESFNADVESDYGFGVIRVDRLVVGSVDLTHPALRAPLPGGDFVP